MQKRKGFTLTEVIVALGVIIALASGATVATSHLFKLNKHSAAMSGAATIAVAISQYMTEMEAYPDSLSVLISKSGSKGPWLNAEALKDPWNQDYVYSKNETDGKFAVWSKGPDKTSNSSLGNSKCSGDDIGVYSR
ncbi:MAG: type II secretion system protein [Phascolarctobacterium sp.]|nr:type II secretion system protein [Candidatus Phascolarctobacterium caballi]